MEIASYSEFRQHMKSFLDAVIKTHKPLFITRKHGEELVVMSKEGLYQHGGNALSIEQP